jgi:peptidyl-prolyl cis-trans isomerase C
MLHVNGEPIEESLIEQEFARLKPQYDQYMKQRNEVPDDARLREWARESVIERTLLHQAAATLDLPQPTEEPEVEGAADDQAILQRKVQQLVTSVTDSVPAPTAEQIQAAYEANAAHFTAPEQVHAAHIVKHTEGGAADPAAYREMLNIRERIRRGESFESLASEHSDCSDNAGDLGTFPRGQMVQEFEDVVFAMDVNAVSDVFQTPFGYHIVKLYEKIDAHVVPLSEVSGKLANHMHDTMRRKAMDDYVDSLKKEASIDG